MENFSYLVEDVACRLFALVFYLVYTKFHLLRIRETSAACFLTWIRFLMFGLVCTNRFEKSITSFSREDNDFCAIETHAEITFHGYFHFWRIKKRFEKTRSVSRNSMFIRSISRSKLSTCITSQHFFTKSSDFLFFLILHKSANTHRSKYGQIN